MAQLVLVQECLSLCHSTRTPLSAQVCVSCGSCQATAMPVPAQEGVFLMWHRGVHAGQ